jgi:membrane fusion protein PltH
MPRRLRIIIPIVLVVAIALTWWLTHRHDDSDELKLYGNVDLRQVSLAFNDSGRIETVLAQEGDRVQKGQVLAQLDTSRLKPQVAQAEAQAAAQRAVVERFHHGSRPEEIDQARASLEAAKADALNAHQQYERKTNLADQSAASRQEVDAAKAAMDMADAHEAVAEKTLALAMAGPRAEDIAQAEAELQADEAQLKLLRQQLADAQLVAPALSTVRSRLVEPGEMVSPQRPVFSLAVTDPKWVRAYVAEPDLGFVRPGMKARIAVDSFPNRTFEGWIGFVSPVAEFTPKSIQTEELRTSLVYEVRVFVKDPNGDLQLGMPATVILPRAEAAPATSAAPDTSQVRK